MSFCASLARSADDIVSLAALQSAGVSRRSLDAALVLGSLVRVRRGWYATPGAQRERVRAARAGGAVACVSAAAAHRLWTPPVSDASLHISVADGTRRLEHPDSGDPLLRSNGTADVALVVHWDGSDAPRGSVDSVQRCLATAVRCCSHDFVFAIIESALKNRRLTADEWRWVRGHFPPTARYLLDEAGDLADSGTESIFRFRMLRLGIRMRSQVEIPGVGRVDFLVGDRLVVEIDSEKHHGSRGQRLRDLNRNAILVGLGFLALRFDYWQVLYDWNTVQATVLAVIARRDHVAAQRA